MKYILKIIPKALLIKLAVIAMDEIVKHTDNVVDDKMWNPIRKYLVD